MGGQEVLWHRGHRKPEGARSDATGSQNGGRGGGGQVSKGVAGGRLPLRRSVPWSYVVRAVATMVLFHSLVPPSRSRCASDIKRGTSPRRIG